MMRVSVPMKEPDTVWSPDCSSSEWIEVDSVKPPTNGFPYWTFYPASKSKDDYNRCLFFHIDEITQLEIQDDQPQVEEVKSQNVRKSQMPDVLSDYRDLTS